MAAPADAHAERLRLATGEILTVEVISHTAEAITFHHPVLGIVTLSREVAELVAEDAGDVTTATSTSPAASSTPQSQPKPQSEQRIEPAAQPEDDGAAAGAPVPPEAQGGTPEEWKFKLVLAAALSEGNTQTGSFSAILAATRELKETKLVVDASYFFAQTNGDRSESRFSTGVRHDWLNPGSKWFFFADARFDADEFQSWDTRLQGHVGIGYRLIEPPKFKLNLLAGAGGIKEWGSDNDEVRPEALLGVEGQYDFSDKHAVKFDSTLFPSLSDVGEFRWVNTLAWSWLIDTTDKLSLTAGLGHEYQSEVDEGREKHDVRLYAGVQLEF